MEIRQHEILCDFCVLKAPKWRYSVPPRTPFFATKDTVTGKTDLTMIADSMGACDDCDKLINRKKPAFGKLAKKMTSHPKLSHLADDVRKHALNYMRKRLKKVIPKFYGRKPVVIGEGVLDGQSIHDTDDNSHEMN